MPDRPLSIVPLVPLVLTVYLAIAMGSVTAWAQSVPSAGDGRPGGVSLAAAGVAVLPFANVSGDLTDEWIGAGIAETVSADFSRLGMSSVVGAALVDGPHDDGLGLSDDAQARRVARDLGMAWVITGGFQRVGGALRVVARIVEVATGDIRRTVTLDGMADELFILQDRIVVELSAGFDRLVASNDQPRAAVFARPRPPGGAPSLAASPPGGGTTALAPTLVGGTAGSAQTGSIRGSVVDQTDLVLPGAIVTLRGNGVPRTAYSDEQGTFELAGVAPGTYTLHVSLAGFSDTTVEDVTVSGAPLVLPPVALQLASFGDTVIVTASRNEVRLIDAPVSTSVISTATLETTSAQNYGDLLRATPGLNVIQLSARDVQVTSRSPGNTLTNSQLVLVDGRSAYLDFFGLVLWDLLPTNFDDVEQIEVVRGPASAVWGANAMTGAVNIITKPPRASVGTTVTLSGGYVDRNDGSGTGRGAGSLFGANATVTRAPNDRLSYRVSAGYFTSAAFARPTGRIPVIDDPRQPGQTVGGAFYPLDSAVAAFGTGFANRGTSQPKFDVRVDQELSHGTLTYAGGVAGTDGLIHSGIGPFDMQSGTYLGYGKLTYTRGALRMQFFTNVLNGLAPNLLLPDLATGRPLQLDFTTQTYDGEIGHSVFLGNRHRLTYGGNVRQNNFDITLAPLGENRLEGGAYLQDEIFWERVRLVLGGRVDKLGNLSDPKFSPRIAFLVKPAENHSVTLSYNRAFRAPSFINNALQTNIVSPVDLSALAPLLPPGLQPAVAQPFPLVVAGVGSDIPIGGMSQDELTEESLTAYEVSYAGVLSRGTTLGGSFYVNRRDDAINFTVLPPSLDPYTATHPPPGWRLPPGVLTQLAQFGRFLPRTAFTYLNLGPVRQTGVELWLEQRVSRAVAASINYSWQSEPEILDDPNPHLPAELNLPPTHRFNAGVTWNGSRLLGSTSVNAATDAFWSDVLTSAYHGHTDGYATVNGSVGVKWQDGAVTTTVKVTNLFNQTIQQHIFGDLLRRTVVGEVKFKF